jgi:pimeloyl-ACP methyl ester carboxylesterase
MELRMQYATTRDGVRIAFGTAGQGSPLIRVPSLPFTNCQVEWAQGSEFFDQIAANWSAVQFDPRGTGLSDRNVTDFSLEARLLDLEAVVGSWGGTGSRCTASAGAGRWSLRTRPGTRNV